MLPAVEFRQAITVIETIAEKTEDKAMYDERLKAQRDYQWVMNAVREEGHQQGMKEGLGTSFGLIQTLQQLLGDTATSSEELGQLAPTELQALITQLQQRVRSRDA